MTLHAVGDEREVVRLSLEPGSLRDLLAGQWGYCFRLIPDPDLVGAYRLVAHVPSDATGEAWLRAPLYEKPRSNAVPEGEPTEEVAEALASLRAFMEWPEAPW